MNDIVVGIITVTLIILLLVVGIFMALSVISKQRLQQEKILAEAKLIFEKELRLVESEVSEKMMTQVAHELHDNIGQLLTGMHIQLENQKIDNPNLMESLIPIETYLNEAIQQLRALSRTLNNDFIGNLGLLESIQLEIDRLNLLKRFKIHYTAETSTSLSRDEELVVFRIFQEIIQNSLRHSEAKNFYLSINNTENDFEFCAEDDGKGFDVDMLFEQNKASGLKNITKRATLASLNCEISSSPNQGTKIIMRRDLQLIKK